MFKNNKKRIVVVMVSFTAIENQRKTVTLILVSESPICKSPMVSFLFFFSPSEAGPHSAQAGLVLSVWLRTFNPAASTS